MESEIEVLIAQALKARERAYAPYSGYQVGACLLSDRHEFFSGANIENASFPASICAERSALAKLVDSGSRSILAIAVATADGATPCGLCRQALSEFCVNPQDVRVYCIDSKEPMRDFSMADLLPHAFTLRKVE